MKRLKFISSAYIVALAIFAAIWIFRGQPNFQNIDEWMNVSEIYGAVLAFIGFPLIVAEFLRFTSGFISINDLRGFQETIKKKISDGLPPQAHGRQEGDFDVLFTKKPEDALIKFYNDKVKSWGNADYYCENNKAAIKCKLGTPPNEFWIVCLSQKQRFVNSPNKDPNTLSSISFTDAEKEIMALIATK